MVELEARVIELDARVRKLEELVRDLLVMHISDELSTLYAVERNKSARQISKAALWQLGTETINACETPR